MPQNYTWDIKNRIWKRRKQGAQKTITRLYTVNPKQTELYQTTHNTSCKELGLPIPIQCTIKRNTFDAQEQDILFNEMYNKANDGQRFVIETVLVAILKETSSTKVFCLTAYAGCEKTFVQKLLLCKLRSMQKQCIPYIGHSVALQPAS